MKKLTNYLGLLTLAACSPFLLPGGAFAQSGDSQDFQYTGGEQIYTVPAGVTEVKIDAWGAAGGNDVYPGGLGGYAYGELAVTGGEQLYIFAGGRGADCAAGNGGGYNGGGNAGYSGCSGGGGGATDIRVEGMDIAHRIIVAGGGGGGGLYVQGGPGGANYGGNTLAGLFQGQMNSFDGGGGGGGYYGGNPGYYPYYPDSSYDWNDFGGFGGTSYTGGVQNGGTTNGVQVGNGHVKITILTEDTQAPVTTASITSDKSANNGWYSSATTLTLSAKDESSGVEKTEYQINNGDWKPYTQAISFSDDGVYKVNYRSVDAAGNTEAIQSQTIRLDQTAPTLAVSLDQTELWEPNHKLVTVNAMVTANDSLSDVKKTELVSIVSSDNDSGSGDIKNASYGTLDTSFDLRAERSGQNKAGRVYTITYRVTDVAGNETTQSVTVTVPHDQKK